MRQLALRFLILIGAVTPLCFAGSIFGQTTIQVPADQSTIQAGINAANNGDTVLVAPGVYNENIDFKGKAITVTTGAKSFSDAVVAATVINGSTDGPVVTLESGESAATVLNGFTVQNGHATLASGLNGGGIVIFNASPTITNNIVTNNIGCGVVAAISSSLIQGNDIKQTTGDAPNSPCFYPTQIPSGIASPGTGLSIYGSINAQVIGNTIEDNVAQAPPNTGDATSCVGVFIFGGTQIVLQNNVIRNNHAVVVGALCTAPSPTNLLLIQNLIYGNGIAGQSDGEQVEISGTVQPPYPTLTEINNTFYGSQRIILSFAPSILANNIFVDPSSSPTYLNNYYGLWCADSFSERSPLTINNNDIFNTVGARQPSGNCPLGTGNISVDPQFLNATNTDFHTQPTSPVVAAGDISAPNILPADLDGKARTVCSTIDMGVYEVRPHPATVLTSSNNPSVGGTSVTFTAKVPGNCNVPTGTVTFFDGVNPIDTVSLDTSGSATISTASLTAGSHNITATYPGDFNFDSSTSSTLVQVVTGDPTATTLQVSPNPANAFQTISLSASVTSQFSTPSGTVTFLAGTTILGTALLSGSSGAAITVSTLGAGTYNMTAVYNATTDFAGSTSPIVLEVVNGAPTTTSLTSAPDPSAFGQAVIFTATVAAPQSTQTPTGSVSFRDGGTTLGTVAVGVTGVASFSTTTLALGSHTVTAVYSGSSNDNVSTSNAVVQVVSPAPTAVNLSASPNPAVNGQLVTLTATVTMTIGGLPSPSGSVVFSDQYGTLGTATLVGGVATFTTNSLAIGTHNIIAVFQGGTGYAISASTAVAEVIKGFDFSLAVSSTSLTIPAGDYEVLTVTLTPIGGYNRAVNLSCTPVPTNAQCVFSPSTSPPLTGGPQQIKLVFNTSQVFEFGTTVGGISVPDMPSHHNRAPLVGVLLLPVIALAGRRRDGRTKRLISVLLLMALTGVLGLQGCSGKQPGSTPQGIYALTISASDTDPSTQIAHSVDITVRVTQ